MTTPNLASVNDDNVFDPPVGITNPPIDELLGKVYFKSVDDSVFEFAGPLVTPEPGEKPLSIALREINDGLLDHTEG